jgi:hypothetical protein
MIRLTIALGFVTFCALSGQAVAQNVGSQLPHAAPLETMQRARSYSLLNHSSETIVAAHLRMTNGQERDLTWSQPVRPNQGREIAVPSTDCLAVFTIRLRSGRTMQSGAPDCRETRIIVTNDAVQIGGSASSRPPVQ